MVGIKEVGIAVTIILIYIIVGYTVTAVSAAIREETIYDDFSAFMGAVWPLAFVGYLGWCVCKYILLPICKRSAAIAVMIVMMIRIRADKEVEDER